MNGQDVQFALTGLGSVTAFGASVIAVAIPPIETPAMAVAVGGLVTALGGLLGSVGNQIVSAYRAWSEQRRAERQADAGMYKLQAALDLSNIEIDRLNRIIKENDSRYNSLLNCIIDMRLAKIQESTPNKTIRLENGRMEDRRLADPEDAIDRGLRRLDAGTGTEPKADGETKVGPSHE